jgi:hypothetical protein
MTPKEKAWYLIEKYYQSIKDTLEVNTAFYYSKKCALIAVEEIIKEIYENTNTSKKSNKK